MQSKIMKSYENEMRNVLNALHKANALKDIIITGSWAMYFYKQIFDDFIPRVETTDLDLYLPNPKRASGNDLPAKLSKDSYIRHNDYITQYHI